MVWKNAHREMNTGIISHARDDVAVNLPPIHAVLGLFSILARCVLYICKPAWQVDSLVNGKLNLFELAPRAEYFAHMGLSDVARKPPDMQLGNLLLLWWVLWWW